MFKQEAPQQVSIFKCENGFGIEVISSQFSRMDDEDNPESFVVKRYVSVNLTDALAMASRYFLEGEI